jgi:hypothetical protein
MLLIVNSRELDDFGKCPVQQGGAVLSEFICSDYRENEASSPTPASQSNGTLEETRISVKFCV